MPLNQTTSTRAPRARSTGLIMTESGQEVLVYDIEAQHIHHLNRVAATIWKHCDGVRSIDEISRLVATDADVGASDETVLLTLHDLDKAGLLDGPLDETVGRSTQSRRAFLRKAAVAGVAVPSIVSMSAPQASASQSTCIGGTIPDNAACGHAPHCCGQFSECVEVDAGSFLCQRPR